MTAFRIAVLAAVLGAPAFPGVVSGGQEPTYQERDFLTRVRRLTVEGKRAGEGYWSPGRHAPRIPERARAGQSLLSDLRARPRERGHQTDLDRPRQDHVCLLPSGHGRNRVRLDPCRSEIETVPGRGAGVPCVGQAASLFLGLRPGDGHLQLQRQDRGDEAPDNGQRLRRRRQLLAGREMDRLFVDAQRLRSRRSPIRKRNR